MPSRTLPSPNGSANPAANSLAPGQRKQLTPSQLEIVRQIAEGKSNGEIADDLEKGEKGKRGQSLLLTQAGRLATLSRMSRPLRIQYEGALYHVVSRGDRREAIFLDDADRSEFLRTLGEACAKMGWQVHAYCLMSNHF